jgi:membrane-associated protein
MQTGIGWIDTGLMYLKDLQLLVQTAGYVGLTSIIFAETGLLIGFFLPGDSLLIAAGLFAARGDLSVPILGVLLSLAAIIGDAVGYWIGRKSGALLYNRPDSFFFRKSHLNAAKEFYEEHGGKTIIFARFIPIIRTFAPTVAGAANMPFAKFWMFNIVGGLFWIWSLLLAGYYLGRTIPNIEKNIHAIVLIVMIVSVLPIGIKVAKSYIQKAKA